MFWWNNFFSFRIFSCSFTKHFSLFIPYCSYMCSFTCIIKPFLFFSNLSKKFGTYLLIHFLSVFINMFFCAYILLPSLCTKSFKCFLRNIKMSLSVSTFIFMMYFISLHPFYLKNHYYLTSYDLGPAVKKTRSNRDSCFCLLILICSVIHWPIIFSITESLSLLPPWFFACSFLQVYPINLKCSLFKGST